ncbi:hypothetical protein AWENTII_010086 [Aspergillus wentii]
MSSSNYLKMHISLAIFISLFPLVFSQAPDPFATSVPSSQCDTSNLVCCHDSINLNTLTPEAVETVMAQLEARQIQTGGLKGTIAFGCMLIFSLDVENSH